MIEHLGYYVAVVNVGTKNLWQVVSIAFFNHTPLLICMNT